MAALPALRSGARWSGGRGTTAGRATASCSRWCGRWASVCRCVTACLTACLPAWLPPWLPASLTARLPAFSPVWWGAGRLEALPLACVCFAGCDVVPRLRWQRGRQCRDTAAALGHAGVLGGRPWAMSMPIVWAGAVMPHAGAMQCPLSSSLLHQAPIPAALNHPFFLPWPAGGRGGPRHLFHRPPPAHPWPAQPRVPDAVCGRGTSPAQGPIPAAVLHRFHEVSAEGRTPWRGGGRGGGAVLDRPPLGW